MTKQKISLILILFLIIGIIPLSVSAFTITPTSFKLTIDPGAGQLVKIKVRNDEAQQADFKLKVLGSKQDEHGLALFGQGFDEAEKWVTPQTDVFTLKSNEERQVVFAITAPKTAAAGGHYLGVGVEKIGNENGAIKLSSQLLSVLSLQVAGIATENLQITEWIGNNKIFLGKNWQFNLALFNKSNIEVPISGVAVVKGWGGREITQTPLNLGTTIFLPGSSRVLKPQISLSKSNLIWPGKYTVEAVIKYGRTNQTALAQTTVWYVPYWFLSGIGVIILLAVWWWLKKNYKSQIASTK